LTFVAAENPSGKDPPKIRPHRHSYISLSPQLSLNTRNLAKLAQATPPWSACIAICAKNKRFFICGLFDQEIHHRNALNQEPSSRFLRPGFFQIEITGVGSLAVYDGRTLLATLNQNSVVRTFHDVLNVGPIAKILAGYGARLDRRIRRQLSGEIASAKIDAYFGESASEVWLRTLSRILLGIKRLAHGGALLFVPAGPASDLKIKYKLHYDKTEKVLAEHIANSIRANAAWNEIHDNYLDRQAPNIPVLLHLDESIAAAEEEDALHAELGCTHFIASLAGVDGLILMKGGLHVQGFGVEITKRIDPKKVFVAGNAKASKAKLKKINLNHFGMRHRSMMRYCYHHRGTVGFVVSQDGDVRAMTRLGHGLIIWENIRLQDVDVESDGSE